LDDPTTDIEQTTLYEKMLEQDWCINVKLSMTPNKILIITTKSQVQNARKWADETLPALYNQHISDKLDVTPLQQMTPWRLDKPTTTVAATTYAEKLIQRMLLAPQSLLKKQQFLQPPAAHAQKPIMTFDKQAFPPLSTTTTLSTNSAATTIATTTSTTSEVQQPTATYDYRAELDCIMQEIETKLKNKIETALQQLDEKFEQKLKQIEQSVDQKLQCLELMANVQAELKLTQANQAKDIEKLTKNMDYLMQQVANITDHLKHFTNVLTTPMLSNSVGKP